jgi:cell division protein FtsW
VKTNAQLSWLVSKTKGDVVIWIIVFLLSLFSLLAVYSSTGTMAYKYQSGNTEYYMFKHFFLMCFGLVMLYLCHKINYKYYSRVAQIMLWASVPLLIFTYMAGANINQAPRWINLPVINLSFQTSDLAKLALIMYTARMLSKKQEVISDFRKGTLPIILPAIIICALIAPANLSTAAVLFATCLLIMFIGRMNFKHIALIIFSGLIFVSVTIFTLHKVGQATGHKFGRVETWVSRIENFFGDNPKEEDFQSQQAKIAVATGGLFGKGPGNSVQKNFLPNPYSDFIFAIIIEEYGYIGGLFLIFLYMLLLYRSIRIVVKSPKAFGALLAVGLCFSLVLQAFVNMGVAVHIFPVTGLTMPLVSMGGTSLWFTSIAFGIILSVSRDIEETENLEPDIVMGEA